MQTVREIREINQLLDWLKQAIIYSWFNQINNRERKETKTVMHLWDLLTKYLFSGRLLRSLSGFSMNIEISKPMQPEGATTRQTVVLGVFFLLLVTTYSSFSQIVTFITQHSGTQYSFVGEVSLITNYLVYLIGLTRAPSIVNFKRQFLIAALCYSFNYALYIFEPEFAWGLVVSVLGAIVGGYGASVLWISQGGYMVRLFRINKIGEQHEGKYLGLQNGLVYGNSLLGAIVTTFCLGLFGN